MFLYTSYFYQKYLFDDLIFCYLCLFVHYGSYSSCLVEVLYLMCYLLLLKKRNKLGNGFLSNLRFDWNLSAFLCYNGHRKYKIEKGYIMGKFQIISHPLIQHKLSILRRKDTSTKHFRELVNEIAMLMGYEVSRELPLEEVEIETPITKTVQKQLTGKKLAIVPILRAGIGMVDGLLSLVPAAKVGHIGMYRDEETLEPVEYLVKLPEDIDQRQIFVVDPMLATGGSAVLAIDSLKKRGAANIKFVCLVSAPEGLKKLQEAHPDIDIYTAALDEKLNEKGYIVPGLGDAGDRLFGTK